MKWNERATWASAVCLLAAWVVSSKLDGTAAVGDRIVTLSNGSSLARDVECSSDFDERAKRAFSEALFYTMRTQPYGKRVADVIGAAESEDVGRLTSDVGARDAEARSPAGIVRMVRELQSDIVIRPLALTVERGSFLGDDMKIGDVDDLYFRVENRGRQPVDEVGATVTLTDRRGAVIFDDWLRNSTRIAPGAHVVVHVRHTPDSDEAGTARNVTSRDLVLSPVMHWIEYADGSSANLDFTTYRI